MAFDLNEQKSSEKRINTQNRTISSVLRHTNKQKLSRNSVCGLNEKCCIDGAGEKGSTLISDCVFKRVFVCPTQPPLFAHLHCISITFLLIGGTLPSTVSL